MRGAAGRVLVVEDERALRVLLTAFLDTAGFACLEAETVDEAVEHLRSEPVDVVLTDMNLRASSGVDLVTQVRNDWPGTAVVLVSGDTHDVAALAKRSRAHGWMAKPFTRREVLETVSRARMRARREQP